jgi:hypothetical protein
MHEDGKDHRYQILLMPFPLLCARKKEAKGNMTNMLLQYAM